MTSQSDEHQPQGLHAEIAAFADEHAGSDLDLDEDLERAGLESLESELLSDS